MTDPVLTDDEKNALLDGVSSGAVEVHSAEGPQYATVNEFVIGPRARLKSNSFPRLDNMNQQLASRLADDCSALLQAEVEITSGAIRQQVFADFCELWPSRCVVAGFTAAPLPGQALIAIDSVLIAPLVEAFFGGNCPEASAHTESAHSPGAMSIVQLFVAEALAAVRDVWAPLKELAPERVTTQVGLDLIETIGEGDNVIVCEFEVIFAGESEQRGAFSIVWPQATVAPLRAALEGKPRDRNAAEDARWGKALKKRTADVVVDLSSNVGQARMTLGQLIDLKPGDVIGIDTPRVATVMAHGVALLEGRFGVQAGRNAVEAVGWLEPDINK